jgi:hypothetical protein
MYPSNLDTRGAYLIQEQHMQEIQQEVDASRLVAEVHQSLASRIKADQGWHFALRFLNAGGNFLTSRILQSFSKVFQLASNWLSGDVQTDRPLK